MRFIWLPVLRNTMLFPLVFSLGLLARIPVEAQGPDLQQRVAEIKEASVKNKQALAQYTWNQLVTISVKGEQKKQEHFQVRNGPDGKPQKTSLDAPADSAPESGGRLKRHIVAKKKEEYKEYADRMKALAEQYIPPDKDLIQNAYQQGNIAIIPGGGVPNQVKLVIKNYVKPGDSLTLIFDKERKQLVQVEIASYMDDPKDAMNLAVQFASLPDGTNHVASVVIDGVSKQLNVAIQNSNYQHV
jgi:hypothetical protein